MGCRAKSFVYWRPFDTRTIIREKVVRVSRPCRYANDLPLAKPSGRARLCERDPILALNDASPRRKSFVYQGIFNARMTFGRKVVRVPRSCRYANDFPASGKALAPEGRGGGRCLPRRQGCGLLVTKAPPAPAGCRRQRSCRAPAGGSGPAPPAGHTVAGFGPGRCRRRR